MAKKRENQTLKITTEGEKIILIHGEPQKSHFGIISLFFVVIGIFMAAIAILITIIIFLLIQNV